jgi:2',3'-cyclic-nucleotide 2'-phosphodiesterase/3'-nucleotidase
MVGREGSSAGITRREWVAGAASAAALLQGGVRPVQAANAQATLRVLATTDLHVHVLPYDYYRDRPDDSVGLARTATLIHAARAEVRNSLLFDNGDLIQGNPMGDWVAQRNGVKAGEVHPIFQAMNQLDYACATVGNHEFNYGLTYLGFALSGAKFPFVCANLVKSDGTPLLKPWIVLDREIEDESGTKHRLKVGVIGFVPPQIMLWDQHHLAGRVVTSDILEAAHRHVPELAKQSDIVVALCHSGISGAPRKGGDENAALYLAEVAGIDAIIAGHQHKVFPGPDFAATPDIDPSKGTLLGIPAVMPGAWGSHLGVLDLRIVKQGDDWKVAGFAVAARPIAERRDSAVVALVSSDEAVSKAVEDAHEGTLAFVRQPVGETTAPINSYFALVADSPAVQVVSQAQIWYVSGLAKARPDLADLPVLSAAAPFKAGGRGGPDYFTSIKTGPVAIKDVADLYLYPNTVRAVKLTGRDVREWLERSAGLFRQIDPARTDEQPLIDPEFPPFNFDVIDGVTYEIDVTAPSRYDLDGKLLNPDAKRIQNLRFQGRPLDPDQFFLVATNNYRASGGGNFPKLDGSSVVIEAPDSNRDVLVSYIREQKVLHPAADMNWRLAPLPGSVLATFESSPKAAKAEPPAGLAIVKLGDGAKGFTKYRLASA